MDKEDARYQKLERLHARRKPVVRLHVRGTPVMQIVALMGLSYPTVRKAVDLFVEGGRAAIRPAARGRSADEGRLLGAEQEALVRSTIRDKRPEQLKMEFALWVRGAVMQFIEREFGIRVSIRATGEYLRRWGFTPHQPIRRACEQRPEAVRQWLGHACPAIERHARAEGGEVHWGEEPVLVDADVRGRSHAPCQLDHRRRGLRPRAAQRRPRAGHRLEGAGAHQSPAARRHRRAHAVHRRQRTARAGLLPGPDRQIRGMKFSSCPINNAAFNLRACSAP